MKLCEITVRWAKNTDPWSVLLDIVSLLTVLWIDKRLEILVFPVIVVAVGKRGAHC